MTPPPPDLLNRGEWAATQHPASPGWLLRAWFPLLPADNWRTVARCLVESGDVADRLFDLSRADGCRNHHQPDAFQSRLDAMTEAVSYLAWCIQQLKDWQPCGCHACLMLSPRQYPEDTLSSLS